MQKFTKDTQWSRIKNYSYTSHYTNHQKRTRIVSIYFCFLFMRKKNISSAHKIFIWVYFITLLFLFGILLHNLFSFCFYKISTSERKVHKEHGTFPRKEQSEMIWHVFVMKIMIGNALFIPGRENLIKNTTLFHTEGPSCTVHFHDSHKRLFLSILPFVFIFLPYR